jgi:SAM-dependent methyltransferase
MPETVVSERDWLSHWNTGMPLPSDPLVQVGRTVGGRPIAPDQIERLVAAVERALALDAPDVLVDLCCGNGMVTARLAPACARAVGVDFSGALIEVARRDYPAPNLVYLHRSVEALTPADFPDGPPTKACMNQGLQFLTEPMLRRLLASLAPLNPKGMRLFFTDVPDAARLEAFYNTPERWAEFERRRAEGTEALGMWWAEDHLRSIFEDYGYAVELSMDPERFTAHYRFDLLAIART